MSFHDSKGQSNKSKKKKKKGRIEDEVLNSFLIKFLKLVESKDINALSKKLKITDTFKNYEKMEKFNLELFNHYFLNVKSRKAFRLIICYIFNEQISRDDYPQILLAIVQKQSKLNPIIETEFQENGRYRVKLSFGRELILVYHMESPKPMIKKAAAFYTI